MKHLQVKDITEHIAVGLKPCIIRLYLLCKWDDKRLHCNSEDTV